MANSTSIVVTHETIRDAVKAANNGGEIRETIGNNCNIETGDKRVLKASFVKYKGAGRLSCTVIRKHSEYGVTYLWLAVDEITKSFDAPTPSYDRMVEQYNKFNEGIKHG